MVEGIQHIPAACFQDVRDSQRDVAFEHHPFRETPQKKTPGRKRRWQKQAVSCVEKDFLNESVWLSLTDPEGALWNSGTVSLASIPNHSGCSSVSASALPCLSLPTLADAAVHSTFLAVTEHLVRRVVGSLADEGWLWNWCGQVSTNVMLPHFSGAQFAIDTTMVSPLHDEQYEEQRPLQ